MPDPTYRSDGSTPSLVLGTAGLGGVWKPVDPEESVVAIRHALSQGVDRLDTAPAYGQAEELVSRVLREHDGPRPFVSTKVGKLYAATAEAETNDYRLDVMQRSVEQSIERLQAPPDLLFLHEPERVPPDRIGEVVDFMRRMREDGLTRSVGLGGFITAAYREHIAAGAFDVVMSFNTLDAACLDGMDRDVPFYRAHGVTTYQGSALHMGLLGNRFAAYRKDPPSWISADTLAAAGRVSEVAEALALPLPELAHRFLLSVREVDHLVIGPRTMHQLRATLEQLAAGPLSRSTFDRVVGAIRNQSVPA